MSYDLQAMGDNGVADTTRIAALPNWDPGTPQLPGAVLLELFGKGPSIPVNALTAVGNQGGSGVQGFADGNGDGAGVMGLAANAPAITYDFGSQNCGVYGVGGDAGIHGVGIDADSASGVGVYGEAEGGIGVSGFSANGAGVQAISNYGIGLYAQDLHDSSGEHGVAAAVFEGRVYVNGGLIVFGSKSAAVPARGGSHRLLYSVESPESWFEDFGEGRLVKGRARVRLEPGFASVINTAAFHIFLTPYGDSNGLYVSRRSRNGLEVREQGNGKSNVAFSYKIVAKRKDIKGERLAKVVAPKVTPLRIASKISGKKALPASSKRRRKRA